jgi:5-methylcytosine-specific restriction endonuclease McrA
MIRLRRGHIPDILTRNGHAWTKELLDLMKTGAKLPKGLSRRYAHAEVKDAVIRDANGKCIYCESKILHVSHGDVEHIKPKSVYPDLTYSWGNLGLVCSKCNNAKRDQYDEATPPINPFEEEPSEHLCPIGEWIWPTAGSDRGHMTIELVDLNRSELVKRRRERLKQIRNLAEVWARTANPVVRAAFAEQLREELRDDREYVFVARAVLHPLGADSVLQAPAA